MVPDAPGGQTSGIDQPAASIIAPPTQLTPFAFDVAIKHDWAPDGKRIVFTDNADNFDRATNNRHDPTRRDRIAVSHRLPGP